LTGKFCLLKTIFLLLLAAVSLENSHSR